MSRRRGWMTLIAALVLSSVAVSGAALACPAGKATALGDQPVVTATKQPVATPASDGTATPKTTEVKTGG